MEPFETPAELAKGYKNLSSKLGADQAELVRITKDGDLSEVYKKLGRPEKPDEYEFPEFKTAMPEEYMKSLAAKAHENGLTRSQLKNMLSFTDEFQASQIAAQQQEEADRLAAAEDALRGEYGDNYDAKIEKAGALAEELFGKELAEKFAESQLGKDPEFIKQMVATAEKLEEQPPVKGEPANFTDTAVSARQKLSDIMNDPDKRDVYFDAAKPGHQQMVQEVNRLNHIITGEQMLA